MCNQSLPQTPPPTDACRSPWTMPLCDSARWHILAMAFEDPVRRLEVALHPAPGDPSSWLAGLKRICGRVCRGRIGRIRRIRTRLPVSLSVGGCRFQCVRVCLLICVYVCVYVFV